MKDSTQKYSSLSLTDQEIAAGAYKQYFGGEAEKWQTRGAYQLALLRHLGLRPDHRLLDVGCGALRGGEHFIRYLNQGLYCGVDYNSDFIRVCGQIVRKDERLREKNPDLQVVHDFKFAALQKKFDFVTAFSVLNHCNFFDNYKFFRNVISLMNDETTILITHTRRATRLLYPTAGLRLHTWINNASDLPEALDPIKWGFSAAGNTFPIIELVARKKISEKK